MLVYLLRLFHIYTLWTAKNMYIKIYRDEEEERSHAILYVRQL